MKKMDYVKYLWLWCKNRNLLYKDKYFNDVVVDDAMIVIKPSYSTGKLYLDVENAKYYLEGMMAALISITMKNL